MEERNLTGENWTKKTREEYRADAKLTMTKVRAKKDDLKRYKYRVPVLNGFVFTHCKLTAELHTARYEERYGKKHKFF